MSKNKGGREIRKPKQVKKPKAEAQSASAIFTHPTERGKPPRSK
jgi:hypothetical protein